jgi:hypothetical protein
LDDVSFKTHVFIWGRGYGAMGKRGLQYSNHTTQKGEIIGVVEIWRVNNYFTY